MFSVIAYMSTCALYLSNAYNLSEEYSVTNSNILGLIILSTFSPILRFSNVCFFYTYLRMCTPVCVDQLSVMLLRSELVYVGSGDVLSASYQADPLILTT
jgi:hypothetical protein